MVAPHSIEEAFALAEPVFLPEAILRTFPLQKQTEIRRADRKAAQQFCEARILVLARRSFPRAKIATHKSDETLPRRCDDELLAHMDFLSRHGSTEWDQRFAAGMAQRAKQRGWRPTKRQRDVMLRLVAEMFDGPELQLIEE
ncbi:hypothetical protein [Roseivivax marinus]|uniref:hypothetical protein n=1 Tax=Roseivivax marinus TaxID=1379903 RepID=UPI000B8918DD|nr:hypothetical protein [Roseivivax marinus]